MTFTLHFLNADGGLTLWRDRLSGEAMQAESRLSALLLPDVPMHPVDVVVQSAKSDLLPVSGACFRHDRIDVSLDPSHPAFATQIGAGEFRRTLYHEYHHALRWTGPGYGATLGEALVTEGLAQHFEQEVEDVPPPVYASMPGGCDWQAITRRAESERDLPYDHAEWFFGTGAWPNWTGYALGYQLVGAYLAKTPGARPSRLWDMAAQVILEASLQSIHPPATARANRATPF